MAVGVKVEVSAAGGEEVDVAVEVHNKNSFIVVLPLFEV